MNNIFDINDNFAINAGVKSVLQYGDLNAIKNPKVTVIVPCYNHPKYLKKALLSAVNQDYDEEYEIVVVDNDDSSEYTSNRKIVEEVNSPKIRYYHNEKNIGGIGNWNRGVELARAPYITYCHDDDMLLSSSLSTLMKYQSQWGDKAVLGLNNYIDQNDIVFHNSNLSSKKYGILKLKDCFEYTLAHHFIYTLGYGQGSLLSTKRFIELGGFGTDFHPTDDAAFIAKYIRYYGAVQVLIPTYNYRFAENDTYNVYPEIAKKHNEIRLQEIEHINIPSCVLRRVATSIYRSSAYSLERSLGGGKSIVNKPSLLDQLLTRICGLIYGISKYKLY